MKIIKEVTPQMIYDLYYYLNINSLGEGYRINTVQKYLPKYIGNFHTSNQLFQSLSQNDLKQLYQDLLKLKTIK